MQSPWVGAVTDRIVTLVSDGFSVLSLMDKSVEPPRVLPTLEMLQEGCNMTAETDSDDDPMDMASPSRSVIDREEDLLNDDDVNDLIEAHAQEGPGIPIGVMAPAQAILNRELGKDAHPIPNVARGSRVRSGEDDPKRITSFLASVKNKQLFDGVHRAGGPSVQTQWKTVLSNVFGWGSLSELQSNRAKLMFLQANLTKLPLERYMAEVGRWAEGHERDPSRFPSSLPPYDHVVDLLEGEFLAGLRKSDIQCTELIFRTKLLDIADKLAKDAPLAQVWQEFKTSLRERSDLPGATEFNNSTLLYLYLSALPTTMYNMLRHVKDGNGNVRDPSDPVVLENSILNLSEVWQEELRRRRS